MPPGGTHRETQGLAAGAALRSRYCCRALGRKPGLEPGLIEVTQPGAAQESVPGVGE